MEAKIIEYKNKKLGYVDYRGAKSEQDIINMAQKGFKLNEQAPDIVAILLNFAGVDNVFTEGLVKHLKETSENNKEKIDIKIAMVGITGLNKTVGQGVSTYAGHKNMRYFDDEETAKEWLVE